MNAEVFASKEYLEDIVKVDFVRCSNLLIGQDFLMNGVWWRVHSINDGRMYYYDKRASAKRQESMGANNQMFVQIIKN